MYVVYAERGDPTPKRKSQILTKTADVVVACHDAQMRSLVVGNDVGSEVTPPTRAAATHLTKDRWLAPW